MQKGAKNLPLIGYSWLYHNSVTYITKGFHSLDSHQPLIAEEWVQYQVSPYGISSWQSDSGTDYFSKYFGFPLPVPFHQWSILIHSPTTNAT